MAADELAGRIATAVDRDRLVETARRLIAVPSPTGRAGGVLDELASMLAAEGFAVERPDGGHPDAPAVAVRIANGPGPTVQFNGHLDTVHLPFVPPSVDGNRLLGSGASDMKGGTAAAVEALRVLREADALPRGSVLLTAHDLHEAPWGFGAQLDTLISQGLVGDVVLIPEPLSDRLPIAGRGQACWEAVLTRPGPPVHEVMRPMDEPDVIAAAARLVQILGDLERKLREESDLVAGRPSVFIGQVHAGEIYNQYPHEARIEGTRRWLPGTDRREVEEEFRALVAAAAGEFGAGVELRFQTVRDAFRLPVDHAFVGTFEATYRELSGAPLPRGAKPFVDDGNSFWALAGVPAITHGPRAGGQHTTSEWADIDDLCRVARLYALTVARYLGEPG